jgi:hypothetical protein
MTTGANARARSGSNATTTARQTTTKQSAARTTTRDGGTSEGAKDDGETTARRVKKKPGERRMTHAPSVMWFATLACGGARVWSSGAVGERALKASATARFGWMDDVFSSAMGPALPLTCALARWFAASCVTEYDRGREGLVPLGTCAHIRADVEAYLYVAATRLLAYATLRRAWPSAFMSDHVFLGASVFTAVHGEVLSCAVDFLILVERREKPLRRTAIMCVALYGVAVMAATCVEVFVTARFYHRGLETAVAAVLGWFVLQRPLVLAVVRPRARELAAALAL